MNLEQIVEDFAAHRMTFRQVSTTTNPLIVVTHCTEKDVNVALRALIDKK